MGAEYFLDTNVFVYRFQATAPEKAQSAGELIERALRDRCGTSSFQVAQEFCNVALRGVPQAMRPGDVARLLRTVMEPIVRVNSSLALLQRGLQLHERYRLAWYDALIVAAAQEARCAILYSEDFQHGQRFGGVEVVNPFL